MTDDRTALSYWFPKIEAAGLPVPRTKTFKMPREAQEAIIAGFDGENRNGHHLTAFARHVAAETADLGSPLFLRTDHTSGKHDWERNCFVRYRDKLAAHMFAIAGYSEVADILGMPWDTWVAREMLPTMPFGICPRYGDMPICREFRAFVDGGELICLHPYWPKPALEAGGARLNAHDFKKLSTLRDTGELQVVTDLARRAGAAVGGAWSVDILETRRGWFVTDMAEAHKSFHWLDCPHEARARRVPA